jgi:hypothetical protein
VSASLSDNIHRVAFLERMTVNRGSSSTLEEEEECWLDCMHILFLNDNDIIYLNISECLYGNICIFVICYIISVISH